MKIKFNCELGLNSDKQVLAILIKDIIKKANMKNVSLVEFTAYDLKYMWVNIDNTKYYLRIWAIVEENNELYFRWSLSYDDNLNKGHICESEETYIPIKNIDYSVNK